MWRVHEVAFFPYYMIEIEDDFPGTLFIMQMSKRNVTRLALCHSCLTHLFFSQILLLPMYTTTFLVIILASHVISHASVLQLKTSVKNSVNVVRTVSWVKKYFLCLFFPDHLCSLSQNSELEPWSGDISTVNSDFVPCCCRFMAQTCIRGDTSVFKV